MSRFTANSSFMRQIRAANSQRRRELEHAGERDRIFRARCAAAGIEITTPDAEQIAARHLLRETPFRNNSLTFTADRLWIGEGHVGNGLKHQAGFGLAAMEACVSAWDGEFTWDAQRPPLDVVISVRDWYEPTERWSWDVRRTGAVPENQPPFW